MDAQREELSEREQRINDVLGAYLEFADAGCAADRRKLIERYPEFKTDLEFFFSAQDRVAELAGASFPGSDIDNDPVGDYEKLVWIGGGGMGIVFRAWHRGMKHWVAFKKIKRGRLASTVEVRRFRAEIEAAATLDHPHIVPIYDVREHRGLPCYSMKLFENGSLEKHLPRFVANPRASAKLMATVARAVHHAHQHGILHRDLKPANILLDADDQPHVTDFGLAKRFQPGMPHVPGPAPA